MKAFPGSPRLLSVPYACQLSACENYGATFRGLLSGRPSEFCLALAQLNSFFTTKTPRFHNRHTKFKYQFQREGVRIDGSVPSASVPR